MELYDLQGLINADLCLDYIKGVFEIENTTSNWKYNPKDNPYNELMLIKNGEAIFYINDIAYNISKENVIFVPKNCSFHSQGVSDNFHYISIIFDFINKEGSFLLPIINNVSNYDYFLNAFSNIKEIWDKNGIGHKLKVKSYFYKLVDNIITEKTKNNRAFKNYQMIKESLRFMENNYFNSDLNLDDIASKSYIDKDYFRKLFKEIYQISPIKHINEIRISKAMSMLRYSKMSINKISESVGYNNVYYFNKIFKKMAGMTPSQYRMQNN